MMKKALLGVLSLTFLVGSLSFAPQASSSNHLSEWGKDAVEQIATCINSSGQKDVVNVLYLIDESGSLNWNDENNLRVQGLKASLDEFARIKTYRPYFTINRAFTTFADSFAEVKGKGWQELDEGTLQSDKKWIETAVPALTTGNSTDYAKALEGAYSFFKPQITRNSCNVLVWFTDGAINILPTKKTTELGFGEICGINPVTGAKTSQEPIIDKFRNSGINIQGILLKNKDVLENPDKYEKYGVTRADVKDESRGMTFFKPIVEYSGKVDTEYLGGQDEREITCGSQNGAKGVVTEVENPIDIIWPPTEFECVTSSGRVLEPQNGFVNIDPGFSRFRASAVKDGFTLKNGAGAIIATSQGSATEDVEISYFGFDDVAISVSGTISDAAAVLKPGKWKFTTAQNSEKVFCGYLDLAVEIRNDPCYENESCAFSGVITRNGRPVDFSVYKDSELRYGLVNPMNQDISYSALSFDAQGKFNGTFSPSGFIDQNGIANLIVTLDVGTKSGYKFVFSAIQGVQPLPLGLYPEINPNPINSTDFTTQLLGKSGTASAPITLKGPTKGAGEICFGELEVRSDPDPKRVNDYTARIDGNDLKQGDCIALTAGEEFPTTLEIKNSTAAKGTVSGFIPVTLKSSGQPDISTQVPVTFESDLVFDGPKRLIIFVICLLLGLLLPLTALKILQVRAARITVSPLSKATTPVILSASGGFVSIRRAEKASGTDIFTADDFEGFMHVDGKEKQIQIGSETLRGDAPLNPFAAPRAILATSPGLIVASSDIWSRNTRGLARHETTASLNPASAMLLTLTEGALDALKKTNQTGDAPDFPIEGTITGLLNFSGVDSVTQVSALNMKLTTDPGWLNNLLKIADLPAGPVAPPGTDEIGGWSEPTPPNDGWGSPTSGTTSSPSSQPAKVSDDGWGSPSSLSGSSGNDWGTTGSAGSSDKKNDDW
jgi:hypothetical protein